MSNIVVDVGPDESLDVLCNDAISLIQKKDGYRFSIDSILLANFIILKQGERMLDIGSGCGIIPVYMSVKGFTNSMVGVEIQQELFEVSLKNRALNRCENIRFVNADIGSAWKTFREEPFRVVASNPPYTREETGRKNPGQSRRIARHESQLTLSTLMAISSALLRKKGRFYVIYPSRRLGELISVARENRLELKRIRFVYPRQGERSNLVLAEFMKDAGIGTTIYQPLYIYEDQEYSVELKGYYHLRD